MGDILAFRKPSLTAKAKANTLCRNGFHKWKIVTEQIFDVKQGKLVTVFECVRCHAVKNQST